MRSRGPAAADRRMHSECSARPDVLQIRWNRWNIVLSATTALGRDRRRRARPMSSGAGHRLHGKMEGPPKCTRREFPQWPRHSFLLELRSPAAAEACWFPPPPDAPDGSHSQSAREDEVSAHDESALLLHWPWCSVSRKYWQYGSAAAAANDRASSSNRFRRYPQCRNSRKYRQR